MTDQTSKHASGFFQRFSGCKKPDAAVPRMKTAFPRFCNSPFGKLLFSTRISRWDWMGAILVFTLTFFFSMLAGQKATNTAYIGTFFAQDAGPIAISIYNTGEPRRITVEPGSVLELFLTKGALGAREYYSITDEEAEPLRFEGIDSFIESTGVSYLIALWWKFVGYPDWSTVYIIFSIMTGLTLTAAYFALRQVTGVLPSILLGLLFGAYPIVMNHLLFWVRDGARAIFCFIVLAVLIRLLKRGLNWKGTIACSLALFAICSLSSMFRNDFIVFIPFIVAAVVFFHGKLRQDAGKKALLIYSIIMGFTVASQMPKSDYHHPFNHVLYVGLADVPYMDYLHFSADNYSKGIAYADFFAFTVGASKAYRDRKEVNMPFYSEEYDEEIHKELMNLARLYPYDFLRLAFSSSIQALRTGYRFADAPMPYIDSAPGYRLFQKRSRDFYSGVPPWLCIALLALTMLLLLGGNFYANVLLCIAVMCMSGCYLLQFDVRHYFYLMLIPLLSFGFLLNQLTKIACILIRNPKKVRAICRRRMKSYLLHCAVLVALFGLAAGILQIAKLIQEQEVAKEIESFQAAKTEEVKFGTEKVPSKIQPEQSAVKIGLPDFHSGILAREAPLQTDFTEFLKVKFKAAGIGAEGKICAFATYESTDQYTVLPQLVSEIINPTKSYPVPMTFVARSESCTLYMPVYFSRAFSPLTGVELFADGKEIEVESVERIAETERIRTQSAFLVPAQPETMKYYGQINWGEVFFGK